MATEIVPVGAIREPGGDARDPGARSVLLAFLIAAIVVGATRWPVARTGPLESDEFGFLAQSSRWWLPMHHTLFMTCGRLIGQVTGDLYEGFIVLDMVTSAIALVSVWWWLRALCRPETAAAGALVLAAAPIFWGYGAMAANYTAIVAVGSFLLGVAYRGRLRTRAWQPYAAAAVLAIGTGYRQDIGTLWLPVFAVILWQHRWKRAIAAGVVFTALNVGWLSAMLSSVGGWDRYRAVSAEYAYQCGYLNSVWNLGLIDAPARYAVKLGMALAWTLGPALLVVPRGVARLWRFEHGRFLALLFASCTLPALASHLLVQFGSAGWAFHYVPSLLALVVLGIGRWTAIEAGDDRVAWSLTRMLERPPARLVAIAAFLAALFWYYPTDYEQPGLRGSFDLAFCRLTRAGLKTPYPDHTPLYWRTANSRPIAGVPARSADRAAAGAG